MTHKLYRFLDFKLVPTDSTLNCGARIQTHFFNKSSCHPQNSSQSGNTGITIFKNGSWYNSCKPGLVVLVYAVLDFDSDPLNFDPTLFYVP